MHSVAESLVAFTAAAALLTITPGLDTALVLRTVASEGPRRGLWSGIGIITGCLVWAASVAAGLAVLLVASRIGYTVLRWAQDAAPPAHELRQPRRDPAAWAQCLRPRGTHQSAESQSGRVLRVLPAAVHPH